jgi:hypothetical protein
MLHALLIAVTLLSLTASASSETAPATQRVSIAPLSQPHQSANALLRSLGAGGSVHSISAALACCTVCSVGKACGDTCISRDKTCHVGVGCACDG